MSSTDRILQMVTERNHPTYPLTQERVILSDPLIERAADYNTRTTMRARGASSGYSGQVDLFYTRVSMTALGRVDAWQEAPFTLTELLNQINVLKNAQITDNDLTNTDVPVFEAGVPYTLMLSAKDSSLVWLGNTQVNLLYGVPASAPAFFNFLNNEAASLFR